MSDIHTHPDLACPHCGYLMDRSANAPGEVGEPAADDITLCVKCGELSVFAPVDDGRLALRELTLLEGNMVAHDPRMIALRLAWRRMDEERRRRGL